MESGEPLELTSSTGSCQRAVLGVVGWATASLGFGFELGDDAAAALTVAGVSWASGTALVPVLFAVSRRLAAKYTARLEAAGYTPVPDRNGRPRYLPPGGRLPGHGNPFAG
ncbi:hypothetical protein [Streptomyces vietnamensis]|uniref:hypothetical protein n=1 Tax=Streptomyces vietnamensis TaxID=362257 RepID=UPI00131E5D15|nr:hypothetical protein [Streptomyces vietnamensis]